MRSGMLDLLKNTRGVLAAHFIFQARQKMGPSTPDNMDTYGHASEDGSLELGQLPSLTGSEGSEGALIPFKAHAQDMPSQNASSNGSLGSVSSRTASCKEGRGAVGRRHQISGVSAATKSVEQHALNGRCLRVVKRLCAQAVPLRNLFSQGSHSLTRWQHG